MKSCCAVATLSVLVLFAVTPAARAEAPGWGTIKGQVVFNGAPPAPKMINIVPHQDQNFCLKNGPVMSEELVVDSKTRGVRWVMVWLVDEKGGNKIPIHPKLAKAADRVVLDQ